MTRSFKKTDEPVIVEQVYPVPPERVWQAITQLDEMRQWYFEVLPDFKPEKGFRTQFTITNEGRRFTHLWEVTEVVPLEKITYLWRFKEYPGEGAVTFELREEGGGTRLRLTNVVTEDFPDNIPEFARESCKAGWEYFLHGNLKAYLEKRQ